MTDLSLFRRVTRYPLGANLAPRENRLTEVTAGVLEHVEGLPQAFAVSLKAKPLAEDITASGTALPLSPDSRRVEVTTQKKGTYSGKRVDLELLFRPTFDDSPAELTWIEVKHGAEEHDNQLETYREDIWKRVVPEPLIATVDLSALIQRPEHPHTSALW